jgi:hypothetical protein
MIVIAFSFLISRNEKIRLENRLHLFSKLGSDNNLSFTSQEILHHCIIGLDGPSKKLVILISLKTENYWKLIDLGELKNCEVKSVFKTDNSLQRKKKRLNKNLQKIVLEYQLKNDTKIFQLPFFDSDINKIYEKPELEKKAWHWKAILSQMICNVAVKTA